MGHNMITFTGMIKRLDWISTFFRSCAQHPHKVSLPAALSVLKGTVGLAAAKRHYKLCPHVTTLEDQPSKGTWFLHLQSFLSFLNLPPKPIYLKGNVLVLLKSSWDFLAVQWLGLYASTAEGNSLIPCQRTKILQAIQSGKKKKKSFSFPNYPLSIELLWKRRASQLWPLTVYYLILCHLPLLHS